MNAKSLYSFLVLILSATPLLAQTQTFAVTDGHGVKNVTVVPLQTDGYTGPSRLTNPRLRDYFGPAGVNVDPALAAELDRRINATGKMTTTHGKTYFASGEFSGKTLGQAVNIITDQFQNPQSGAPRSALDRDGANAAFFNKQTQPSQQTATPVQPIAPPSQAAYDESNRVACLLYPAIKDPDSALSRKRQEVYNAMQATGNMVPSPDLPLIITVRAANLLGIKPVTE